MFVTTIYDLEVNKMQNKYQDTGKLENVALIFKYFQAISKYIFHNKTFKGICFKFIFCVFQLYNSKIGS